MIDQIEYATMSNDTRLAVPPGCLYSIDALSSGENWSSYCIRENDDYGEFPNIYAQVYYKEGTRDPAVIFLSDTGTGKNLENESAQSQDPTSWNFADLLANTLNPSHQTPYVILLSHCHYDHIMGIAALQQAGADLTIYGSSHDKGFLVPWSHLQKNSLAEVNGLKAPKYDVKWADDAQELTYVDRLGGELRATGVTVMHTPGHTPDSISWYDRNSNVLSVGDMIYERESDWTRSGSNGQWAREPPQPIIFNEASNIPDWTASLNRLLDFVRSENRRLDTESEMAKVRTGYRQTGFGTKLEFREDAQSEEEWSLISSTSTRRRVVLSAAHVTVTTDAEYALLDCLAFMLRIKLDQVPRKHIKNDPHGGGDVYLWDDALERKDNGSSSSPACRFSVKAPWKIIHGPSGLDPPNNIESLSNDADAVSFRSVIRQTMASKPKGLRTPLKSSAIATISHGNATAHRK